MQTESKQIQGGGGVSMSQSWYLGIVSGVIIIVIFTHECSLIYT